MKILFVLKEEDPIDPMNVELLSALAKRAGHETDLAVLARGDLDAKMETLRPEVVAYSGKTGEHKTFFRVNRELKRKWGDRVFTVMGGPHPTFNHAKIRLYGEGGRERTEVSDLDAMCVGEGDDAWVELLDALENGEPLARVPNLVTKERREPEMRPRRSALDDLPHLDRGLVYENTFLGQFPMRSHMAGRGCPFRCTYCFNYDWNKTYREAKAMGKLHNRYSVGRLIEEINAWRAEEKKRGWAPTQFIKFYDDVFVFRADAWLREFAERFPEEVGLPFFCLVRCDILAHEKADGTLEERHEVLDLLVKAGLKSISMSIEAGNDFVRENVLVRDMTRKEILTAFRMCRERGIATFANTILGIPAPVIPKRGDADFDAKLLTALRVTEKAFTVAKKSVEPGPRGGQGMPATLPALLKRMEEAPDAAARAEGVALLRALGLHDDPVLYDIESVEMNLECGVDHTMFPRLDPYPGTVVTDYTIAIGAFDGDFEKLHASYDTTSSFTCFSGRDKRIQDNLSFLGQVCALLPWLWPLSKRVLIHLPLTRVYWLMFLAAKTWVIKFRIYPMRFTWASAWSSAKRIFSVEYKKFFRGAAADASPTGVLGGRWDG